MPDYNALRSLLKLQSPTNRSFDPEAEATDERSIMDNAAHNSFDASRMEKTWNDADAIEQKQREEVDAIHQAQLGSHMRGFEDPQSEARYGRKQEERKLELPLEEAKINAQTTIDRLLGQQEATDARTKFIQEQENGRNDSRISNQQDHRVVPNQMYDAVTKARSSYEGGMNSFMRRLGVNGGQREYMQTLTNLLDRKGTLADADQIGRALGAYPGSLDERIQAFQNDPDRPFDFNLDDTERAYLTLKLGQ